LASSCPTVFPRWREVVAPIPQGRFLVRLDRELWRPTFDLHPARLVGLIEVCVFRCQIGNMELGQGHRSPPLTARSIPPSPMHPSEFGSIHSPLEKDAAPRCLATFFMARSKPVCSARLLPPRFFPIRPGVTYSLGINTPVASIPPVVVATVNGPVKRKRFDTPVHPPGS